MDLELYKKNAYASHQPIVRHVLSLIEDLPILELGSGDGSTTLIHELSQNFKITVDSDEGWI